MRSLWRHVHDIVSDNRIIYNDIIGFTETQIKPSSCTSKTTEALSFYNISFRNNENKILSLADRCKNDVAILIIIDANGLSTLSFQ